MKWLLVLRSEKIIKLIASLVIVLAATISSSHATNLVLDGGFEGFGGMYDTGPLGAWTLNVVNDGPDGPGVYGPGWYSGANVTEGNRAFDMGMDAYGHENSISQTLATIAGMTYTLSFDWGSEYDWGTDSIVTVGTALSEVLIDEPNNAAGVWIDHSSLFSFIADGNDILTFTQNDTEIFLLNGGGLSLDNIVVVESAASPIPEPSTMLLLGTGLVGLVAFRRKFSS